MDQYPQVWVWLCALTDNVINKEPVSHFTSFLASTQVQSCVNPNKCSVIHCYSIDNVKYKITREFKKMWLCGASENEIK